VTSLPLLRFQCRPGGYHGVSCQTGQDRPTEFNCGCTWRDEVPTPSKTASRTVESTRERRTDFSRCAFLVGSRHVKVTDEGRQPFTSFYFFIHRSNFLRFLSPFYTASVYIVNKYTCNHRRASMVCGGVANTGGP
jgi:hypothetical protein